MNQEQQQFVRELVAKAYDPLFRIGTLAKLLESHSTDDMSQEDYENIAGMIQRETREVADMLNKIHCAAAAVNV